MLEEVLEIVVLAAMSGGAAGLVWGLVVFAIVAFFAGKDQR